MPDASPAFSGEAALRQPVRAPDQPPEGAKERPYFSRGNFHVHSEPGILLSRKPPNTQVGNRWALKKTMAEKNGQGINPIFLGLFRAQFRRKPQQEAEKQCR